jgi:hypothetical protein
VLVSELIDRTRAASDADPGWLGSDEHLELLGEFVSSRAPGTSVVWIDAGERSYKQAGRLALEKPTLIPGFDAVQIHAIMSLHEVHHAVYTDHDGAAAMRATLSRYDPVLRQLGESAFNWLEDARMRNREHSVQPGNDQYVAELHRLSIMQEEQMYALSLNEQPWTGTPTRSDEQLRVALAERILVGDRGSVMAPIVAGIIEEITPIIDVAVSAAGTDGARLGAVQITAVVAPRFSELVAR